MGFMFMLLRLLWPSSCLLASTVSMALCCSIWGLLLDIFFDFLRLRRGVMMVKERTAGVGKERYKQQDYL